MRSRRRSTAEAATTTTKKGLYNPPIKSTNTGASTQHDQEPQTAPALVSTPNAGEGIFTATKRSAVVIPIKRIGSQKSGQERLRKPLWKGRLLLKSVHMQKSSLLLPSKSEIFLLTLSYKSFSDVNKCFMSIFLFQ